MQMSLVVVAYQITNNNNAWINSITVRLADHSAIDMATNKRGLVAVGTVALLTTNIGLHDFRLLINSIIQGIWMATKGDLHGLFSCAVYRLSRGHRYCSHQQNKFTAPSSRNKPSFWTEQNDFESAFNKIDTILQIVYLQKCLRKFSSRKSNQIKTVCKRAFRPR